MSSTVLRGLQEECQHVRRREATGARHVFLSNGWAGVLCFPFCDQLSMRIRLFPCDFRYPERVAWALHAGSYARLTTPFA
jgi:hypothetical protein